MSTFNVYSRYYDLLYKDKNYKAESEYVLQSLQRFSSRPLKNLLELGCGSGSHALHFCKNGCQVTGIERSQEMVNAALAKKIKSFKPLVGDITDFELSRKFDAAVSLFHVVSYLTQNKDLISCFYATQKHLKKGGLFLFDIWYSPAVYYFKPETRIKRMEDDAISVTRIAESVVHSSTNTVDVHFEVMVTEKKSGLVQTITEKHPMRHFSLPEIEMLANYSGFELLCAEEFLTRNQACDQTWGVCVVLQKK